ncbi:MAG TPA: protein phosphatase 2C domain-containing protein [Bryobacteraceae bacterium]|nr:protein phosphatase 2C domain-containing protein [Bryobacteraceae bacterium]
MDLEFALLSDPGRIRGHNEDFAGYAAPDRQDGGWLFAVADGVGGQEFGEVASRAAVDALTAGYRGAASGEQHSTLLARLVQAANIQVYETGRAAAPGGAAMATTLVACALRYDRATIAHVGDSRCYLIRHNHAMSLTRDHTVVNEQVRLGVMSAREAAKAETRHVLSRSLGLNLFVNVDVSEHHVVPGDVLLLCSDGLHGAIPPGDIARSITRAASLSQAARTLVDLANQNDGSDNVTALLIRIRSVQRVGMYRGRPYKLR